LVIVLLPMLLQVLGAVTAADVLVAEHIPAAFAGSHAAEVWQQQLLLHSICRIVTML
jgi:hypothetical protein